MRIINNYILNFQNYFTEIAQINPQVTTPQPVQLEQPAWRRFSLWCNEPITYKIGKTNVTEPKALLLASVCSFLALGLILYLL